METKRITEGAIILALYTILLLIFVYLPVIGGVFMFLLPIPFIFYTAKYNWKSGTIFFIAAMLISAIVHVMIAIPATFLYGLTGLVFGACIYKKHTRMTSFIVTTLTFLISLIIQYVVSAVFFDINYIKEAITVLDKSIQDTIAIIQPVGIEQAEEMIKLLNGLVEAFSTLIPSLLVIASAFVVLLIQLISLPILKRLGLEVPGAKPFRELSIPKSTIWYFLFVILISFFAPLEKGDFLYNIVTNLVYILETLFVFQGITFIFYYSYYKRLHKAIPIIITVFLLSPLLSPFIRILGIIDVGFELRKRISG